MASMKPLLSILFLACMPVMGEQVDSDRADREAYKDGWADGDDGSSSPASLGGWVLGENAKEPNIAIASSSGLGTGKTDIDTGGVLLGDLLAPAFEQVAPGDDRVDVAGVVLDDGRPAPAVVVDGTHRDFAPPGGVGAARQRVVRRPATHLRRRRAGRR